MKIIFAVLLVVVSCWQCQESCSLSDMYIGAVVEYSPTFSEVEEDFVKKNVANYVSFMKNANSKGADIIVFPEGGLGARKILSSIPEPFDHVVPCDNPKFENTIMKNLSCGAKNNRIYSVINLPERRECQEGDKCPSRGYFKYNTNVVFDRNGKIVARYAKFNLFDEFSTDRPSEPEMVFFDTDFNVRFGTFICFDILFPTPALQLIQQYNITDFVFSTAWFSELPFLTALQAQRGWAESNDVNLLASGFNLPMIGSSGSGIYNGKFGALVQTMPEVRTSKLLIAKVPKSGKKVLDAQAIKSESHVLEEDTLERRILTEINLMTNSSDNGKYFYLLGAQVDFTKEEYFRLLEDQIDLFNSKVLESGKTFAGEVCSRNQFCCSFRVTMEQLEKTVHNYNYRAVVFDGVRTFGKNFTGGVQVCGIVVCNGSHIENCTNRVENISGMFKFREIYIEGNFLSKNAFQMPTTLIDGDKMIPLPSIKYEYKTKGNGRTRTVSMELSWPVDNLNTFGIWGRDFTRDGDPRSLPFSRAPFVRSLPTLFIGSVILAIFSR